MANNADYDTFSDYVSRANDFFLSFQASYGATLSAEHRAILTQATNRMLQVTLAPAAAYAAWQQDGVTGVLKTVFAGIVSDAIVVRVAAGIGIAATGTAAGVIGGIIVGVTVGYGISAGLDLVEDSEWFKIVTEPLKEWASDPDNTPVGEGLILETIVIEADPLNAFYDQLDIVVDFGNSIGDYAGFNWDINSILKNPNSWDSIADQFLDTITAIGPDNHAKAGMMAAFSMEISKLLEEYEKNKDKIDSIDPEYGDNLKSFDQKVSNTTQQVIHLANVYGTPLVLDLDGDGISTISMLDNKSLFDFTDRTEVSHGWIDPSDGFLVLDRNDNGLIDSYKELFGSEDLDGFSMLAEFDENNDGIIDNQDAIFSQLRVWVDQNSDAVSQNNELFTLEELGIASINLDAKMQTVSDQNNLIPLSSHFTLTTGETREIADVYFSMITEEAKEPLNLFSSRSQVVLGSNGNDTLAGDESDQIFIGGAGADTFVFSEFSGNDIIYDFDASEDIIEIIGSVALDFSSIYNQLEQHGDDVIVHISDGSSVLLHATDIASLSSENFRFA